MAGVRVIDRATGEARIVDSAAAQDAVLKGHATLADRTVRVSKGGKIGTVDAGDLGIALGQGARIVDESEASAITLAQQESTVGAQAIGGLEAAARGVSLGLSDMAIEGLGADPERMRARQDALGGAGTALEIGGAIAPILLTGGGGAAAVGAKGAAQAAMRATPAALAARAGSAAAKLVPGTGRGAGLVRAGAAAGIEGGIAGAGQAVSEATLWNRDVTAEDLTHGALLGSALGIGSVAGVAGLGAAARGTVRGSKAAYKRVAKAVNPAGEEITDGTANALRKRDMLLDPKMRKVAANPEASRAKLSGEIAPKYKRAHQLAQEADDLIRQRPGKLSKLDMTDVDPGIAMRASLETAEVTGRRLDEIAARYPTASKSLKRLQGQFGDVVKAEGPAAAYQSLDEVGGSIEREIAALERSGNVELREAAAELRTVGNVIGSTLDDSTVWKGAVNGRKSIRTALDGVVGAETTLPAGLAGGKMDPAELIGLARKGDIDQGLAARMQALETIAAQRDVPKSTLAKIDEYRREIGDLRRTLKNQKREAEALDLMDSLGRFEEGAGQLTQLSGMVGAGALAGKVAGIAGLGGLGLGSLAASALGRPKALLGAAAGLIDYVGKIGANRNGAVAAFGRKMAGGAAAAGKAAKVAAPRITREAALKVARDISRMDMTSLVETESDTMQYVSEVAPRTAAQASATLVTAVEFLKSKAPAQFTSPWGGPTLVDPSTVDRYTRYLEAVTTPDVVWDRLASGTLMKEHVEAIKTVYPNTYREVQATVMEQMATLTSPPPFAMRITLGTLLDLPLDPSLSPQRRALVDGIMAAGSNVPPPSGGRSTVLAGGADEISERADKLATPGAAGEVRRDR